MILKQYEGMKGSTPENKYSKVNQTSIQIVQKHKLNIYFREVIRTNRCELVFGPNSSPAISSALLAATFNVYVVMVITINNRRLSERIPFARTKL